MPTPATSSANANAYSHISSSDAVSRLRSLDAAVRLEALREIKNQIIGSRTKKLKLLKLGAVPILSSILLEAMPAEGNINILVESATDLGSFSCGLDPGVQAVLDSSSLPNLILLLSHPVDKVVNASSFALRMIYKSKLCPKLDLMEPKNIDFINSLLDSSSDSVSRLGATIISHSCRTKGEQEALYDAGVVSRLATLLNGSLDQRHASLDALAAVYDKNDGIIEFRVLASVIELTKDRCPKTKLLACSCLVVCMDSSAFMHEKQLKSKIICMLLDLLEDAGDVGDDTSSVLSKSVCGKEDMQLVAFESNAIDKLCGHLQKQLHPRRTEGMLLVLGDICSELEACRSRFLSLEGLDIITDALNHEEDAVRAAACLCFKNVTRSIKNLCAGTFLCDRFLLPLMKLLEDPSSRVQDAALSVICNIVISPIPRKYTFAQYELVNQLIHMCESMEPTIRQKSLCTLRNSMFLATNKQKEEIFSKLTVTMLSTLIRDSEPCVQEQALGFLRNTIDGCLSCIDHTLSENGMLIDSIKKQVKTSHSNQVRLQGMHVLNNIASGNEHHKDVLMKMIEEPFMLEFLKSGDDSLRVVSIWVFVNLTHDSSPGSSERCLKLRNSAIISQIKNMVMDPCLDVKFRAGMCLRQITKIM